jgi:hypothetical protein
LAVLVTLVYLASQVRESKSSTDTAAFVSIVSSLNESSAKLVTDSAVAELV